MNCNKCGQTLAEFVGSCTTDRSDTMKVSQSRGRDNAVNVVVTEGGGREIIICLSVTSTIALRAYLNSLV